MKTNITDGKVKVRIDPDNKFCYTCKRHEIAVKTEFQKIYNKSFSKDEVDKLREMIEEKLILFRKRDMILPREHLDSIFIKQMPGGPGFNTGSFVSI